MSEPMKILLATDGSDDALAATGFLMGMPLPPGTRVTVMSVLKELLRDYELVELPAERREEYEAIRNTASAEARQLLDTEGQRLRSRDLVVDTLVCSGHAAKEIVRVASEGHYDIIAIGTHGTHDPKHFLLGSVSSRVFEYAPCSVLLVRPASGQSVSDGQLRILLGYDDSPAARAAAEMCASLPLSNDSALKAVTALPLIHMFRQDVRQQLNWVWKEKKEKAQQALDRVNTEVDWSGVKVTTELIESSDVAQALIDEAAAFDSDLLVIGNKGKHRFERFLLGSVTAHVALHAPCSVLSVREPD